METPHLVPPWGLLGPLPVLGRWHWAYSQAGVDSLVGHTVHLAVHSHPLNCSADMDPYQDASAPLRTVGATMLRPTEGSHKVASEGFSA